MKAGPRRRARDRSDRYLEIRLDRLRHRLEAVVKMIAVVLGAIDFLDRTVLRSPVRWIASHGVVNAPGSST